MAVDIVGDLKKIQDIGQAKPDVQVPAGGYKVTVALLHHGIPANEYPIGRYIQKIYIFEDIEKFGITGWIEMLDVYNLVRNGIILGEELLYLQFSTAGTVADAPFVTLRWQNSHCIPAPPCSTEPA